LHRLLNALLPPALSLVLGVASASRLPTVFAREQVDAGGLVSDGTSPPEATKHMAVYADKILKGAKPEESPSSCSEIPALGACGGVLAGQLEQ
jgi:ABC-type uncharacterized transport system substrate-binding protein